MSLQYRPSDSREATRTANHCVDYLGRYEL